MLQNNMQKKKKKDLSSSQIFNKIANSYYDKPLFTQEAGENVLLVHFIPLINSLPLLQFCNTVAKTMKHIYISFFET